MYNIIRLNEYDLKNYKGKIIAVIDSNYRIDDYYNRHYILFGEHKFFCTLEISLR